MSGEDDLGAVEEPGHLLDDLDGKLLASEDVHTGLDLAIAALAQGLPRHLVLLLGRVAVMVVLVVGMVVVGMVVMLGW